MTKKYIVIGNPIDHSLSPAIHNHWFKKNKIDAFYDKELVDKENLNTIIDKIRNKHLDGANITVPFKNLIVPLVDRLTSEADVTKSVNTIYLDGKEVVGHNTDIAGFELAIRYCKYDVTDKKVLILGAGGVVSSVIYALNKMKPKNITLSNRTKEKAERLKKIFPEIKIINWGETTEFDMIINATSIGLNEHDSLNLNFQKFGKNKFFYDVIYKPKETVFLKEAKKIGNQVENGKMMFIYQAHQAFAVWNKIFPLIDNEVIDLIDL